jgi:hypothetical protein
VKQGNRTEQTLEEFLGGRLFGKSGKVWDGRIFGKAGENL